MHVFEHVRACGVGVLQTGYHQYWSPDFEWTSVLLDESCAWTRLKSLCDLCVYTTSHGNLTPMNKYEVLGIVGEGNVLVVLGSFVNRPVRYQLFSISKYRQKISRYSILSS